MVKSFKNLQPSIASISKRHMSISNLNIDMIVEARFPFPVNDTDTIRISEKIILKTDFIKVVGKKSYMDYNKILSVNENLQDAEMMIEKISMLSATKANIMWNMTFIPENLYPTVVLAKVVGINVIFYNLLNRENQPSLFSWQTLLKAFLRILTKGELVLPHAVIRGQTELSFNVDEADEIGPASSKPSLPRWTLIESVEKINLVKSLDRGILKNRRLVLDVFEFMDSRKPPDVDLNDWNNILSKRLDISNVPGMGQFDIDGLNPEQQNNLLDVSGKIMGYATGIILLLGVASATVVMDNIFAYHETINY
jgi:hypothetical protein